MYQRTAHTSGSRLEILHRDFLYKVGVYQERVFQIQPRTRFFKLHPLISGERGFPKKFNFFSVKFPFHI